MKPEDPGPLRDAQARQDLKAAYGAMIDEGLRNLEKAISLDPEYDDAMAYMNLLVRERADMDETQAEYQNDIKIADDWVQKSQHQETQGGAASPLMRSRALAYHNAGRPARRQISTVTASSYVPPWENRPRISPFSR